MASTFVRLSQILTGYDGLPQELADVYLRFLESRSDLEPGIGELLAFFAAMEAGSADLVEQVRTKIVESERFGATAQRVILAWYAATYTDAMGATSVVGVDPYFQGLLWPTIHAHVPGLSGGYCGYWSYPPEN